jgi:hypothetical protein
MNISYRSYYSQAGALFQERIEEAQSYLARKDEYDDMFAPYYEHLIKVAFQNQKTLDMVQWVNIERTQAVVLHDAIQEIISPSLDLNQIITLYQLNFTKTLAISNKHVDDVMGLQDDMEGFIDNINQDNDPEMATSIEKLLHHAAVDAFLFARYEAIDPHKETLDVPPLDRKRYNRLRIL